MNKRSAGGKNTPETAGSVEKATKRARRKGSQAFVAGFKARALKAREQPDPGQHLPPAQHPDPGQHLPPAQHPDSAQLLHPARLLARFTERATELISQLPQEACPTPSTVSAALRQGVLEAFRTRDEHIARLVETDLLASSPGQGARAIRRAVRASLIDMGVRVVEEADEQELFVVVEGEGEGFEMVRPAYVDQATGKLLLAGQLRRVPVPRALSGHGKASTVDVRGDDDK